MDTRQHRTALEREGKQTRGDLPGQPPLEGSREFPIGSARKGSQAVSGGPSKEVEFKVQGGRGREEVVAWRRALETCRGCPSAGTQGSYQGQKEPPERSRQNNPQSSHRAG